MVEALSPMPDPDAVPAFEAAPLAMINLPERGQKAALPWLLSGVVFYVVVSFIFFYSLLVSEEGAISGSLGEIVGLGESPNLSIAVLVITGVLVTIAAIASVARDLLEIRAEESDVEWLILHKREYAQLVLAAPHERDALRRKGQNTVDPKRIRIETLVDDRVRRMMSAQGSTRSAMVPVEELRVIAQTRTARLGSFARYATSLLLLLAVLGTFAGVKTALPGLIDAVTAGNQPGGLATATSLVDPLRAVADAFGANALALIGAIAVGLMAHGIAVGRRNFLERLELVSAEYIYGARQMDSADPLRTAVEAMRDTVERVRETSGSLLGIESGLTTLGRQFAQAFESLDERLTAIVEQQDERLHERTSRALEELRERIAEMAEVVDANTRAYAGLVDRVGESSAAAQLAIQQLGAANQLLAQGLEGAANLGPVAQNAGEEITASIARLEESTTRISRQVEAIGGAVGTVGPALEQVRTVLTTTAAELSQVSDQTTHALADVHDRAAQAWVTAGREMEQHIARLSMGNGRPTGTGTGSDSTQLLRQIAASLDSRSDRLAPAHLLLLPMVGTAGGGMILYGLYRFSQSGFVSWILDLVRLG